jgi:hypothetical protein
MNSNTIDEYEGFEATLEIVVGLHVAVQGVVRESCEGILHIAEGDFDITNMHVYDRHNILLDACFPGLTCRILRSTAPRRQQHSDPVP